ncbi:MAG: hypothetical protein GY839_14975 [candidate division Zixibacteria bacterium]|nr:hypothetical protein [candidate division Zixibacteria bacterium]
MGLIYIAIDINYFVGYSTMSKYCTILCYA